MDGLNTSDKLLNIIDFLLFNLITKLLTNTLLKMLLNSFLKYHAPTKRLHIFSRCHLNESAHYNTGRL